MGEYIPGSRAQALTAPWSDAEVNMLIRLWATREDVGLTAIGALIEAEHGARRTGDMVRNQVRKLGLTYPRPCDAARNPAPKAAPEVTRLPVRAPGYATLTAGPRGIMPAPLVNITPARSCQWPTGERPVRFECTEPLLRRNPVTKDKMQCSYCLGHYRRSKQRYKETG